MKIEKIMKKLAKKFGHEDFKLILYPDMSGYIENDPLWETEDTALLVFDNWEDLEFFVK